MLSQQPADSLGVLELIPRPWGGQEVSASHIWSSCQGWERWVRSGLRCKWQAPRALSVLDLAMVAPVFLSWFRGGMGSREMWTCSPHTWVTEAKNLLDSPVPGKPGNTVINVNSVSVYAWSIEP